MKKTCSTVLILFLLFIVIFFIVISCKPADSTIKIGLSFANFATERWYKEKEIFTNLAEKRHAEVITFVANNDIRLQNEQIESLIVQNADVIIIIAVDGDACSPMVDKAKKAGIPCIAYDRLIKTGNLACYITFNNIDVGRQQAAGILKRINKGNFVLLGGSPSDNNAHLLRKGQLEMLDPYIKDKSITIVADKWVENWEPSRAMQIMEEILNAGTVVDAIVASNDGTALGAIQALEEANLAGKIPVSGQDATVEACKSIVEKKLTLTIFKDFNKLAPLAMEIAFKLINDEPIADIERNPLAELALDETLTGSVPCKFLEVQPVDLNNIYTIIIEPEIYSRELIFKSMPEENKPPKPGN